MPVDLFIWFILPYQSRPILHGDRILGLNHLFAAKIAPRTIGTWEKDHQAEDRKLRPVEHDDGHDQKDGDLNGEIHCPSA